MRYLVLIILAAATMSAGAMAQDVWVTTPDGTLTVGPFNIGPVIPGQYGYGPAPQPIPERLQQVIGYCIVLRDMVDRLRDDPNPPTQPTAEELADAASCDVMEGQGPRLFAEMRPTIAACRDLVNTYDPIFGLTGYRPPALTPDGERALTACRRLIAWIGQKPRVPANWGLPPSFTEGAQSAPEPLHVIGRTPREPAVNEIPDSSASSTSANPEPWRVIRQIPCNGPCVGSNEPRTLPRSETSR